MGNPGSTIFVAGAAALALALPADAQERPDDGPWWSPVAAEVIPDVAVRNRGGPDGADHDRRDRGHARDRDDRREEARARDDDGDEERWENDDDDREDRWEDERDRGRRDDGHARDGRWDRTRSDRGGVFGSRGTGREAGSGPPFCRNGEGHPVHGWQWCVEKGWADRGLRDRGDVFRDDARWERTRWDDVIFRRDLPARETRMDEPGLLDVLGSVILGRLDREARISGDGGPLDGRWLAGRDGGSVLQVRAGNMPLAELTDADGDGRVDLVFLNEARGRR